MDYFSNISSFHLSIEMFFFANGMAEGLGSLHRDATTYWSANLKCCFEKAEIEKILRLF